MRKFITAMLLCVLAFIAAPSAASAEPTTGLGAWPNTYGEGFWAKTPTDQWDCFFMSIDEFNTTTWLCYSKYPPHIMVDVTRTQAGQYGTTVTETGGWTDSEQRRQNLHDMLVRDDPAKRDHDRRVSGHAYGVASQSLRPQSARAGYPARSFAGSTACVVTFDVWIGALSGDMEWVDEAGTLYVDWGDGKTNSYPVTADSTANVSHQYTSSAGALSAQAGSTTGRTKYTHIVKFRVVSLSDGTETFSGAFTSHEM